MSVWLKRIVFTLVVLLIATTVGIAIFLLTFNPNAYKHKLQDMVYARYHRTLTIGGDIGLSLFPRIGLSVRDVALSDREGSDVFVSVDSARFAVAIWPLLFNRLVVDHVAVSGLKAWVVRDADGRFNFSDLLPEADEAAQAGAPAHAAAAPLALASTAAQTELDIDIAGLDLKNGQVRYRDEQDGMSATLSRVEAVTGRVTFDQAFDVAVKGQLAGMDPAMAARFDMQALLRLNPAGRAYSAQKINVQLNGRVGNLDKAAVTLRGNLAYSPARRDFAAENLELNMAGQLLGAHPVADMKAALSAPRIRLDQRNNELQIERLALRATGKAAQGAVELAFDAPSLAVSPESAKGDPVKGTVKLSGADRFALSFALEGLSGNANELRLRALALDGAMTHEERLLRVQLSSPLVWDRSLRRGSLPAIKGDVSLREASAETPEFEFPLIGSVHSDQFKDVLDIDLNAVIDGSQLAFKSQTKRLPALQTRFSLAADRLDLNRWFPASIAAEKPAEAEGKDADGDKADGDKAPEAGAPEPPQPVRIDWSALEDKDITGSFKIGDLRLRDVQLRDVVSELTLQEGVLTVSGIKAGLYEGTLTGELKADSSQAVAAKLAVDKVAAEPFLRALTRGQGSLSGTLAARADFKSKGDTADALARALEGRGTWQLRDGALHGVDAAQTLRELSAALRGAAEGEAVALPPVFASNRRTPFSAFDGRIDFRAGVGTISKLQLNSDLLRVTEGKPATVSLAERRMDLMLNAQINSRLPKDLGEAAAALRGIVVPVQISGPFDSLSYDVQWPSVRNQALRQLISSGLMGLLPPVPAEPPAKPQDEAPAVPADPVKRIGEALKGLLGQ